MVQDRPYWQPLLVGEHPVNLPHLEPIDFTSQAPAKSIRRIHVVFSNHVFTTAYNEDINAENQRIFQSRVFCPDRFRDSAFLPKVIAQLPTAKVVQTWEKRNYVYYTRLESRHFAKPYHVFFELRKRGKGRKGRVEMRVESAYQMSSTYSDPKARNNSIRFYNLVENTYMSRPIKFARRK